MKLPQDPKKRLLLSLAAAMLLGMLFQRPATVAVVVTTRSFSSGETITAEDLRVRRIDVATAPASTVTEEEMSAVMGKMVVRALGEGEALYWSAFAQALPSAKKQVQRQLSPPTEIIYGTTSPESSPE